ncbi:MAG: hypothetical protein LBI19_01095 [Oscillospiraceae bacterium]|jgi:predicted transcriptional regulator YdeE|nr:hypothetical protein [Oscillospiraceae bacterium]
MAEIIKTYKQNVSAARFIGKKYGNADRVEGMFGAKWGEWFQNGWFGILEKQMTESFKETYADGDAYIGLMREFERDSFEYWIGMFLPEDAAVPEGFESVDFPKSALGVCWIYGKEDEVYCREGECGEKLGKEGFAFVTEGQGADWCFERYACPRFTTPDEKGNIILDICFFVK